MAHGRGHAGGEGGADEPEHTGDGKHDPNLTCAENNPWNPLLPRDGTLDDTDLRHLLSVQPEEQELQLDLADLDAAEDERVRRQGQLVFHTFGCSGDPVTPGPQDAVAAAIAAEAEAPDPPSFLYHLGDIAYKDRASGDSVPQSLSQLLSEEFYAPYRDYRREIFAIAGNHDGKWLDGKSQPRPLAEAPMFYFLRNFCAERRGPSPDDPHDTGRRTQPQPYPYWLLNTPFASFIGLFTNVLNGGQLDPPSVDPTGGRAEQYQWLVTTLRALEADRRHARAEGKPGRAILLMLHYPPFSGAASFVQRGDPSGKRTPKPRPDTPLADILFAAFQDAHVWPDAIFSAHAHHYQRITCKAEVRDREHRHIPCIIAGCGGHVPIERMGQCCDGENTAPVKLLPFDAVLPQDHELPRGVRWARVERYNDTDVGYLRVTVNGQKLIGEFRAVSPRDDPPEDSESCAYDRWVLDLESGKIEEG